MFRVGGFLQTGCKRVYGIEVRLLGLVIEFTFCCCFLLVFFAVVGLWVTGLQRWAPCSGGSPETLKKDLG